VTLPFVPHQDPRVIDSTGALELDGVPKRLLVIDGGIIGLEMATVYHALGSKVTVVELMDQIIPGAGGKPREFESVLLHHQRVALSSEFRDCRRCRPAWTPAFILIIVTRTAPLAALSSNHSRAHSMP
jgi:hypothetical protein